MGSTRATKGNEAPITADHFFVCTAGIQFCRHSRALADGSIGGDPLLIKGLSMPPWQPARIRAAAAMPLWRRPFHVIGLAPLVLLTLAACDRPQSQAQAPASAPPPAVG